MGNFHFLILILWLLPLAALGQEEQEEIVVDSSYREDQVYLGFTYNLLTGSPKEVIGSQFSGGFHAGFIRDFSLNSQGNIALAAGLGWSINTFGQNLFIGEEEGTEITIFKALDREEVRVEKNRFSTHGIDLPVQFRWRTSTPETYKFWRVYAGLRPSYIYHFRSSFVQPGNEVRQTNVPELNRFRLGATFTFGYNTFNFHFYYSLNSFFNNAMIQSGDPVELRTLQVGLMFYLL